MLFLYREIQKWCHFKYPITKRAKSGAILSSQSEKRIESGATSKISESEKDVKWCHSGSQSEKDPRVVPLMRKWTNQVIVAQNRPCESCSIFGQ